MDYKALIHKLFEVNLHGGVKLGLSNCLKLSELLGYPHNQFSSIHIAGSNGKGSVTTKIAKALEASGKRVGLYTSPHISTFRERIRINGEMISEEAVCRHLIKIFHILEKENIPATFFEITTLLAFDYFAEQKVDVAAIETGLGGRLDATNIISPILTIITSISLEHTDILGQTIEEITLEKAGIIKKGVPLVIGPEVPFNLIQEVANEQNSPLIAIPNKFTDYEEENCAIAKKALEQLKVEEKAIQIGLNAKPPCRFEVREYTQPDFPEIVILDVAHNTNGLEHLFKKIQIKYPNKPIRILFGLSKNKDLSGCVSIIKQNSTHFHPVEAPNGRGVKKEFLKEMLIHQGIEIDRIFIKDSITGSMQQALRMAAESQEILLICGTFFIMDETKKALGIQEMKDLIDINERFKP